MYKGDKTIASSFEETNDWTFENLTGKAFGTPYFTVWLSRIWSESYKLVTSKANA